ncbi:ATP-binding cassette domain-containing protein [Arcanobacterium pinnipediorum]|uniref:ATP-binding cassette domain-containing protein n=1 Tax=Arcanobacterium pinnipediorum TaxID=1503041 RepID=A0ABY5AIY7_9ACTO|nr:ATP-binding cassette domain-containing protein [Arcanobacterium pinnipediorum]USR79199.1 ATP-binding cassette domain-containing protein [Arcanobacterium pinnipediorum]
MITVDRLSKNYGKVQAVRDLSFTVREGAVTGFLGPNGSGKSTTLRCLLGLDNPNSGVATIDGKSYASSVAPITKVGALLDGKAFNPKVTARRHLEIVAATHAIPATQIDHVLQTTGLTSVAKKKVGGFSLGMSQRLGIATALIGDPEYLIFDEPVNGLDPDGVKWVRNLMRHLAGEGRTVLVSSHLMSEMSLTADDVVIIGRGQLIDAGPIGKFTHSSARTTVQVAGPETEAITQALRENGIEFTFDQPEQERPHGRFTIAGSTSEVIGHLLYQHNIELHELCEVHSSLEDVFMELTDEAVDYRMGNDNGGAQ